MKRRYYIVAWLIMGGLLSTGASTMEEGTRGKIEKWDEAFSGLDNILDKTEKWSDVPLEAPTDPLKVWPWFDQGPELLQYTIDRKVFALESEKTVESYLERYKKDIEKVLEVNEFASTYKDKQDKLFNQFNLTPDIFYISP